MNKETSPQKTEDNTIKLSIISVDNIFQNKYSSARYCIEKTETKEVAYENRIFNIKKKFTVPSTVDEVSRERKISILNQHKIKAKPSEVFSKHTDNIIKNRRLLRKGVWDMPFEPDTIIEVRRHRYKTQKQQSPKQFKDQSREAALYKSSQHKKKNFRSTRNLQQEQNRQLPVIRNSHDLDLPIRLSTRYGSKPISCKTTEVDEGTQNRNIINRKIAVELINYNLLGKWACSSMKL